MDRKIIVIVGPTCSGKTKLSLILAQILNSEIISADSRQVYKLLDIGTAKPFPDELNRIKHHLINLCFPDEDFNVSKFEKEALQIIKNLNQRDITPIVCGGSGLYIKGMIDGIPKSAENSASYRNHLNNIIAIHGREYLYEKLKEADPVSASKMLPQNWKRVMRALEVLHLTGKPIWQHYNEHQRNTQYEFIQFGLEWNRTELYLNINKRVDEMIDLGLTDEVRNVLALGYNPGFNSLNTVGYKEIISYLNNEISLERAIELIKRNTRHFAKRQLTWFRKDNRINWLQVSHETNLEKLAHQIIKLYKII